MPQFLSLAGGQRCRLVSFGVSHVSGLGFSCFRDAKLVTTGVSAVPFPEAGCCFPLSLLSARLFHPFWSLYRPLGLILTPTAPVATVASCLVR